MIDDPGGLARAVRPTSRKQSEFVTSMSGKSRLWVPAMSRDLCLSELSRDPHTAAETWVVLLIMRGCRGTMASRTYRRGYPLKYPVLIPVVLLFGERQPPMAGPKRILTFIDTEYTRNIDKSSGAKAKPTRGSDSKQCYICASPCALRRRKQGYTSRPGRYSEKQKVLRAWKSIHGSGAPVN